MSDIVNHEPQLESLARFQSLQSGQYWTSKLDIQSEGIRSGSTLLIQSIKWVDNKPHTIVLRPHPLNIGKTFEYVDKNSDGSETKRFKKYSEHLFLLDDFLNKFDFEPDHSLIRNNEIKAIQSKISGIQSELMDAQSNPEIMDKIVDKAMQSADTTSGSELAVLSNENTVRNASIATGSILNAINTGITVDSIESIKSSVNKEHRIATIKSEWIQSKTSEIAETITKMTPFYQEQAAAALAQTEDVKEYVAKLMKGIESLDLYVGKDVHVREVCKGASASKEEPLTLVQNKLMVDEELAVWADIDQWFDFTKIELFFEKLKDHKELVNQIFPTERCVLVMATTRRNIDYGDRWANNVKNEENKSVFLMARDGENVYQITSPVESHLGSSRLFPSKNEQDDIFKGYDGSQIKFEDVAYSEKLSRHDAHALHYKRFLLLLCGLDHRLKLFGDFYEGPQSFEFVSMSFQERFCRFLHDDDGSGLLPVQEIKSVKDWIEEKNTYLRSGSRVLINWREIMNPDTAPAACKSSYRSSNFDFHYYPENKLHCLIAYKNKESICVDLEVSGLVRSGNERSFLCKVDISEYNENPYAWRNYDSSDMAYLCLDMVSPEELHRYIHNRGERTNQISYIRFFKSALKYLLLEREEESDTRDMLHKAVVEAGITDEITSKEIISNAVTAWRSANRGKSLPKFINGESPPEWPSLLDQIYILTNKGNVDISEIEKFAKKSNVNPLRFSLTGNSKFILYAKPSESDLDNRLEPFMWVQKIMLSKTKNGYSESYRSFAILPNLSSSETIIHEWDGAEEWLNKKSLFSSPNNKKKFFDTTSNFKEKSGKFLTPLTDEGFDAQIGLYKRSIAGVRSKYVVTPSIYIPFGVYYNESSGKQYYICAHNSNPEGIIYGLVQDEDKKSYIQNMYVSKYQNKQHAKSLFTDKIKGENSWSIILVDEKFALREHGCFAESSGFDYIKIKKYDHCNKSINHMFNLWKDHVKEKDAIWISNEILDATGNINFDDLFGTKNPDNYKPIIAVKCLVRCSDENAVLPYKEWIDVIQLTDEHVSNLIEKGSIGVDLYHYKTVEEYVGKSLGSSGMYFYLSSTDEAMQKIDEEKGKFKAVNSKELMHLPQPPEGIDRWIFMD